MRRLCTWFGWHPRWKRVVKHYKHDVTDKGESTESHESKECALCGVVIITDYTSSTRIEHNGPKQDASNP